MNDTVIQDSSDAVMQSSLRRGANPFFGSRIWVLYMALKPSKRPLICRRNEVANTIKDQVMGPRSGVGQTPQNVKMVPPEQKWCQIKEIRTLISERYTFYFYDNFKGVNGPHKGVQIQQNC